MSDEELAYLGSGVDSVISDEACFGLVPEGVSYRSDYSYQKHICTIRSRV